MILITNKHEVDAALRHFFPYINMYKASRLKNVAAHSRISDEFLSAVVINCIISEVELLFRKKIINNKGPKITFQLTEAQGVVLYETLQALPLPAEEMYMQLTRQNWINQLDQQVITLLDTTLTPKTNSYA